MHGSLKIVENSQEIPADLLWALREIMRRAVMTLVALKDPDRQFMGWSRLPMNVVHDVSQAYGYVSASIRNFAPSPHEIDQMEVVLPWLAWLRREEGDIACKRILGWSMGSPLWKLAQRENCSERTILNRMDRSICAVVRKFVGVNVDFERIEEPYKSAPFALVFERPTEIGREVVIKRVYIGGQGYFRGSKRLRRGDENLSDAMIA